jgi:hypothetical protein
MRPFYKAFLPFLLVLVLVLSPIYGCGGTTGSTGTAKDSSVNQPELAQIFADSLQANMDADSYQVIWTYIIDGNVQDGSQSNKATVSMDAKATFAETQKQMKMSIDMSSHDESTGDRQDINMEVYVLTDNVYASYNGQWMKLPLTEAVLKTFSADMFQEELKVMESPDELQLVRHENYEGTECYVIKFVPNSEYLRNYASKNTNSDIVINWDKVLSISDIYKDISYTVWIAKESKLLLKMDNDATLNFTDEFASSSKTPFTSVIFHASGNMKFSDYNKPVTIALPAEATSVKEVNPDSLSQ